jgi:hypothetical protein
MNGVGFSAPDENSTWATTSDRGGLLNVSSHAVIARISIINEKNCLIE